MAARMAQHHSTAAVPPPDPSPEAVATAPAIPRPQTAFAAQNSPLSMAATSAAGPSSQQAPPTASSSAAAEARRRVEIFLQALMSAESFDQHTLQGLQLVSSQPGSATFTLPITPQLQNRYGTLHGGAIATLVDVVGSLALITQTDRSGVSLAINTLYLNPMPGGDVVEVSATVIKLGRDVATIEVALRQQRTGRLVATGTHTKKLVTASDMSALFEATQLQPPQQMQQTQQQTQTQQQQQQQQHQTQQQRSPGPRSRL